MIDSGYARTMARYNAWQNGQIVAALDGQDDDVWRADRGAFFGSILGTLNHLLFGDTLWMSRFDPGVEAPSIEPARHKEMCANGADWQAGRVDMDAVIMRWADQLKDSALKGDLSWYSGAMEKHFTQPLDRCVAQFFNHQTHHRGQVHAMLTSAGLNAPVSDLIFLPEDA